jgi:proteasome lid subunit RPN8/RPN11
METTPKTDSPSTAVTAPRVEFASEVLQQIRQHARTSMDAEICGVLIGSAAGGVTRIAARIPGEGASQGGAHVTFTQDAWEHIYKIKDAEYPSDSIVGWYHSHPGFGIFLSEYDLFIHENFFNAAHQVAWVFDPHSDEEGCFGWIGKKIEPLSEVAVLRKHRQPPPEQIEEEAANREGKSVRAPMPMMEQEKSSESARGLSLLLTTILMLLAFGVGVFFGPQIWYMVLTSIMEARSAHAQPAPSGIQVTIPPSQDLRNPTINVPPAPVEPSAQAASPASAATPSPTVTPAPPAPSAPSNPNPPESAGPASPAPPVSPDVPRNEKPADSSPAPAKDSAPKNEANP